MPDTFERLKTALADRYAIEREIGAGGMATVYLAEDLKHHRKVAVKVLRLELAAILGAERFLKEIEVTANLQHPHILPLFDSGEAGGEDARGMPRPFLYYVMPHVEGESLRERLEGEKQLAIEEAVRITTQVAEALDYAHRHDVIHRDIKPENILLHDGKALVADFGIALAVQQAGGSRLTETGLSLGTPSYMSPEQATADRKLTGKSDVYSLACVTYEMLVGDPPHIGSTAQAVIAKVITEDPQRITAQRKTVPPQIEAAVHKALAKLPADRFGTAADFAAALSQPAVMAAPFPTGDVTLSARARPRTVVLDRRVVWAGIVSLVALAGAAAVGWLRGAQPAQVARFSIVFPEDQRLAPHLFNDLAVSPDGSAFVYRGLGADGRIRLYFRPMAQLTATAIPGTEGGTQPFFSPDGQSVGFTSGEGTRTVNLAGSPPILLTDSATGGSWGRDGSIYFTAVDGAIGRMPAGGGPIETLASRDTAMGQVFLIFPDVLPNGKGVLAQLGATQGPMIALIADGEIDLLFPGTFPRYASSGHILYLRDDGALLAVPFDQDRLEVTGPPVAMIEGVASGAYFGAGKFAISENGLLLYQPAAKSVGLVVFVDRDGAERVIETEYEMNDISLSPDGTRVAFASDADIWILHLETGNISRFTFEGDNGYPGWTPDGTRVTFYSTRNGEQDLYWKPADMSAPEETIFEREGTQNQITFSQDGKWMVYREGDRAFNENTDLSYVDESGEHHPFLHTNFLERNPRLSPDGRWLAYVSNESGRDEVYVRAFPGPGGVQQISSGGGAEPKWAHNGRELFLRTLRGLMAVEVRSEPTFSMGTREMLFTTDDYQDNGNHTAYDVTPDDRQFVFVKSALSQDLVVVLNWFEELRERVGN